MSLVVSTLNISLRLTLCAVPTSDNKNTSLAIDLTTQSPSVVIGRKDLGLADSRCSRHQFKVERASELFQGAPQVQITVLGINPCAVLKSGEREPCLKSTGETALLHTGDHIFAVGKEHQFAVKVTTNNVVNTPAPSLQPIQPSDFSTDTTSELSRKRHLSEMSLPEFNPPPIQKGSICPGGLSALFQYVQHPEMHAESVFLYDKDMVAIYDKFPKAKIHLLFMPRK